MESYLAEDHFDLVTPDGKITKILHRTQEEASVLVRFEDISSAFVGFSLDSEHLFFNSKSTLGQIGIDGIGKEYSLDRKTNSAEVHVLLKVLDPLGKEFLPLLESGIYIGKLFAADPRRRVRDRDYLFRMFGRTDREGLPLLSFGNAQGSTDLILEKIHGYTVAFLPLKKGIITYEDSIHGLIPTLAKALKIPKIETRRLLSLHQKWNSGILHKTKKGKILLVKTLPLHVRTVFGRVVNELLPEGFSHTSANVLEPNTKASGDIYEFFGNSIQEIEKIPLEFYTLEPHREYVFFADRDQLQNSLENSETIFQVFHTAPKDPKLHASVFIVKGTQLLNLTERDWITRNTHSEILPGFIDPNRQSKKVQLYIEHQSEYPFLKAIQEDLITSQGILFSRYFPSPLMKKMLLNDLVQNCLKGIYFKYPSRSNEDFFSHEDRSMLIDLAKFAIPIFWADRNSGEILRFTPKPNKDTGMFVPLRLVETFSQATSFGIYGSALVEDQFEEQLTKLLEGIKELKQTVSHALLNKNTPIALITGGGPGVMEVGNRVAKKLHILSCANIVDFSKSDHLVIEQRANPYIEAKMTYRIDRLVERQGEFNLDFPIFLMGGFGTDFEFGLEQVRRKVGSCIATPVLLFGNPSYWAEKITPRFQMNRRQGTIAGSEWVSNCFYCIQTASQGLKVYEQYFSGTLPIGKQYPPFENGFKVL